MSLQGDLNLDWGYAMIYRVGLQCETYLVLFQSCAAGAALLIQSAAVVLSVSITAEMG